MPIREILDHVFKGRVPPPRLLPETLLDLVAHLSSARGRVSELNSIERLLTAMRHKEPDHVPCTTLMGGACRRLIGASFDEFSQDVDVATRAGMLSLDLIGGDVALLGLDLSVEASDFGQSVIYPKNSTVHPDYENPFLSDHTDYHKVKRIDVKVAPRMQRVIETEVDVSLEKEKYILTGRVDLLLGQDDTLELLDFKSPCSAPLL